MGQTKVTGIAADKWGRSMAKKVAQFLGTEILSPKSNEIELQGERLVIKCAHKNVPQIGLSLAMLNRVDGIIAAFEDKKGKYSLYRISPSWYKGNMVPSLSTSHSAHKVKMAPCKAVRKTGRFIAKMSCMF